MIDEHTKYGSVCPYITDTYSVKRQSSALKISDLDLLSAGMSAVLGTKVEPRMSRKFRRDWSTFDISADDFFLSNKPDYDTRRRRSCP